MLVVLLVDFESFVSGKVYDVSDELGNRLIADCKAKPIDFSDPRKHASVELR